MKIEKVNENQIRCTLTREDLASRELKISELAYGTEKAKSLFRDMMQQANFEFGFEAEDIPLMIEAIPLNADCIVLIITKVEDPEELDTRFPALHLPLRKTVMMTVMRARQTRFWICSAVSRAKTIPQTLLKLLPRPLPRRVTVYVPACSVWNL